MKSFVISSFIFERDVSLVNPPSPREYCAKREKKEREKERERLRGRDTRPWFVLETLDVHPLILETIAGDEEKERGSVSLSAKGC